jgi:hypothetical protein
MPTHKPRVVHKTIPTLDMMMGGLTIRTRTLEDGRVEAASPNYPDLAPVQAETARLARSGYERRIMAYAISGLDADKANKTDVSGTSRDRTTCG